MEARRCSTVRQLELMLQFLEGHHELALGRIMRSKEARAIGARLWSECAEILNSEGPARTGREWAKVWNDYKCRVRSKLGTINANQKGTGTTIVVNLTPLEDRVATMLSRDVDPLSDNSFRQSSLKAGSATETVTGDIVMENGVEEREVKIELIEDEPDTQPITHWDLSDSPEGPHKRTSNIVGRCSELFSESNADGTGDKKTAEKWKKDNPREKPEERPSLVVCVESNWSQASTSSTGPWVDVKVEPSASPTHPPPSTAHHFPRRRRLTARRLRNTRNLYPQRATRPATQSELARTEFPRPDVEWRAFQREKERHAQEMEKQKLKLREIELQQQAKWQDLFAQLLSIMSEIAHKYVEKNE